MLALICGEKISAKMLKDRLNVAPDVDVVVAPERFRSILEMQGRLFIPLRGGRMLRERILANVGTSLVTETLP